jgi:hypothetical protein
MGAGPCAGAEVLSTRQVAVQQEEGHGDGGKEQPGPVREHPRPARLDGQPAHNLADRPLALDPRPQTPLAGRGQRDGGGVEQPVRRVGSGRRDTQRRSPSCGEGQIQRHARVQKRHERGVVLDQHAHVRRPRGERRGGREDREHEGTRRPAHAHEPAVGRGEGREQQDERRGKQESGSRAHRGYPITMPRICIGWNRIQTPATHKATASTSQGAISLVG